MELNFNSVETIPVLNASAALKTDRGELLMLDYDIGDLWEIYISAEMDYGNYAQHCIPGGSILVFDIELLVVD